MHIIHYPHPTLRHLAKPLRRVDARLKDMVGEMFDLMYADKGVGLAATQVDLPMRLFILNLKADPKARDEERVFINPVIAQRKGQAEAEEGCLSLPSLYGDVIRPERITINAYNLAGEEINETVSGLLARVIQHETDHLDGVLFVDRMSEGGKMAVREKIEEFEIEFDSARRSGRISGDQAIAERLAGLEAEYC